MAEIRNISDYLAYEPKTGVFTWIKRPSYNVKEGATAGTDDGRGYMVIQFNGKFLYCHRVAFTLMGEPLGEGELVDHKNQNTSDNTWENLRRASHSQNSQNRKTPVTNTSGVKGVCWDKHKGKWRVYCQHKHFGYFSDLEEAKEMYQQVSKRQYQEFYNES